MKESPFAAINAIFIFKYPVPIGFKIEEPKKKEIIDGNDIKITPNIITDLVK